MSHHSFKLQSEFAPAGDQPKAISRLSDGLKKGREHQTLLGVTGSGKTYTAANVIEKYGKPTLVIAHNKTLAAQLAQEYRSFFPNNAVSYFVSYYDYYQPEAYVPVTDTYIEKEAQINEEIDRLRHEATQSLLTRRDVIVVASVSCIYGLGSPVEYEKVNLKIERDATLSRRDLLRRLVGIYFERTPADLKPGYFRVTGNTVEIMPVNERVVYRVELSGDTVASIMSIDPVSREVLEEKRSIFIFPAKHFVTPEDERGRAIRDIQAELEGRVEELKRSGRNLEAERLTRRTRYDLAMIREVGYCNGIENYSRHFSGRKEGDAPDTLLSYFPHTKDGRPDFLTVIDESHVTVSQIAGMYAGDRSRKETLIEHGFRLPSAKDNRPLTFDEFDERIGLRIYTSATPGEYEIRKSCPGQNPPATGADSRQVRPAEFSECDAVVEQIVRPTGLIDPKLEVRPVTGAGTYRGQIADFITEAEIRIKEGGRVIATTLTKRMAEDLSQFLVEKGIKTQYLHSDIKTIERIEILSSFRRGEFDCLVGVNLLREGLDLPEVTLIGILDADKEGFLRSGTSLIQTIGRAARNVNGRVILYADRVTGSMKYAMDETERRRTLQIEHNKKHGITPRTIEKKIYDITESLDRERRKTAEDILNRDRARVGSTQALLAEKEQQMEQAVRELDFETAAIVRDEIQLIKERYGSG